MTNTRILLLGFSCTEMGNGYAKHLVPELSAEMPNAEIYSCGLGGLTPPVVPAFLKNLHNTKGPFTHIVFEISTSSYAWFRDSEEQNIRDVLLDLLLLCNEINATPLFLMLHRKVDQPHVVDVNEIIRDVCNRNQIDFIDLAEGLVNKYGVDFADGTLRDLVHTTDVGARLQSDLIQWRLIHWIENSTLEPTNAVPLSRRIPLSFLDLVPNSDNIGVFERRDYEQKYVEHSGDNILEICFDKPKRIMGFTYLMGPESGFFKYGIDGPPSLKVAAFDERCYYTRIGYRSFNACNGDWVTSLQFQSDSGHEEITLLKGDKSPGPAKHRFLDIFELQDCA